MAWGKRWPTTTCTISCHEILSKETDNGDYVDDALDSSDILGPVTETFKCLLNIDLLQTAFDFTAPAQDLQAIVVLREYDFLRRVLEDECKGRYVLVTGHPGTGKTVFILYLLLYRLEKELPTAVQFSKHEYAFFDAEGASLYATNQNDSEPLPRGCWCLCDGNVSTKYPCHHFMRPGLRTFLVTSSSPERYKKWRNQTNPMPVVTALPRTTEVAAIAKMHGFRPCDAVSILQRWGPCIHTILSILNDQRKEAIQEGHATGVARNICRDPSITSYQTGDASIILFIIPIRRKDHPGYFHSRLVIPSPHLAMIFEDQCQSLSLEAMMTLYELFSNHPILRGPASWRHEKNMHLTMATTSKNIRIFNSNREAMYMNSANIHIRTLDALRTAASARRSFYWIPFVADFPGVDGVLVNVNRLFALQATIANTHDAASEGLRKIWKTIGAEAAHGFIWHFVIVTDDDSLAVRYARDLGTELSGFTLGRDPRVKVSVWVCSQTW